MTPILPQTDPWQLVPKAVPVDPNAGAWTPAPKFVQQYGGRGQQVNHPDTPDWTFGQNIPQTPLADGDIAGRVINAVKGGWDTAMQGIDVTSVPLHTETPQQAALNVAQHEFDKKAHPGSSADDAAQAAQNAKTGWDAFFGLGNPQLWPSLVGGTAAAMIPPVVGGMMGGAVAGIAGPEAAPVGMAVGTGLGSFASDYSSTMLGALTAAGLDPSDPNAMVQAFSNPQIMARARDDGLKHGIPVAIFDALTAGFAGRLEHIVANGLGGTFKAKAAGLGAEALFGAVGGMGGETAGQLVQSGQITDPGSIAAEGLLDVPGHMIDSAQLGLQGATSDPVPQPTGVIPNRPAMEQPGNVGAAPAAPDAWNLVPAGQPIPAVAAPPVEQPIAAVPAEQPIPVEQPAAPVEPLAAPVQTPEPVVQPVQPVQQAPAVQPVQQDTPVSAAAPEPAQAAPASEPVPAPAVNAPVAAPTTPAPVSAIVPAAPVVAPLATPGETIAPVAAGSRAAPTPHASSLRLGNALRTIEAGLPAHGGSAKARARIKDNLSALRNSPAVEHPTDQNYRIGDTVTVKGQYKDETIIAVKNGKDGVMLTTMSDSGNARQVRPGDVSMHNATASDAPVPALRPVWYAQHVENTKGLDVGSPIVTASGEKGHVVGMWKSKSTTITKEAGITRKPINVAYQPEGAPEGVYRTAGLDSVHHADSTQAAAAVTKAAPVEAPAPVAAAPADGRTFGPKGGNNVDGFHHDVTLPDGRKFRLTRNAGDGGIQLNNAYSAQPLDARGNELPGVGVDTLTYSLKDTKEAFASGSLDARLGDAHDKATAAQKALRAKTKAAKNPTDMMDSTDTAPVEDRKPRGTLAPQTEDVSTTKGRSIYEQAYTAAGITADEGVLMAPRPRLELLRTLLLNTFGFKHIDTMGANMKDATNQMLDAFRNVAYMMHALGLPMTGVSLNGTLGLHLEKDSGRYYGVYRGDSREIGLPGRSNSFAHEWGHALDHHLIDILKGRADMLLSQLTRKEGLDPTKSVENAFVNLIHHMFHDEAGLAARVLQLEQEAVKVDKAGNATKGAIDAQKQIDKITNGSTQLRLPDSQTRKNAKDFAPGNPYWPSVHEMFARAFEAYVANRVETAGGTNEFITKGERAYLSGADRRLAMTFPKGLERENIFSAFDDIFDHIRNDALLGVGPAAAKPLDTDINDPQHWNKTVLAQGNPTLWQALRKDAIQASNAMKHAKKNGFGKALLNAVSQGALNAGWNPNNTLAGVGRVWGDAARALLGTTRIAIVPRIWRNMGKRGTGGEVLMDAWKQFVSVSGGTEVQPETFDGEKQQGAAKDIIKMEVALRGNGFDGLKFTAAENDQARSLLFGEKVPAASPELHKVAAAFRRIMEDLHSLAEKAGVEVGYITQKGYLPRIINSGKVVDDVAGFTTAATKLYGVVFDNLMNTMTDQGLVDTAMETDAIAGNSTKITRFDAQLKAFAAARKALKEAQKALAAKPADATLQANVAQALIDRTDTKDALAAAVKPVYSTVSARAWQSKINLGDSITYDSHGPASNFTSERTLPPEADEIMKDFYQTDVTALVAGYSQRVRNKVAYVKRAGAGSNDEVNAVIQRPDVRNRIHASSASRIKYDATTPTGRRNIISDLTNTKADNILAMRMREAELQGANPNDIKAVRDAIDLLAGSKLKRPGSEALDRVTGFIHAYTFLKLLPRAAITSLSEPATLYLRTGSPGAALKTFTSYLSELHQTSLGVQERQALARAIGLVSSPLYDVNLLTAMGMDHDNLTSGRSALTRFFRANFLTQITNAQRRSAMAGGFSWMRDMAQLHEEMNTKLAGHNAADTKAAEYHQGQVAAEFAELGVRPEDLPAFLEWLRQSDTLPTVDDMNSSAGHIFEQAMHRFVGMVIQEPTKADKPMYASTPVGRLVYGLTSFIYKFFSSVHAATAVRGKRNFDLSQEAGYGTARSLANALGPAANSLTVGFSIMFVGQFLTAVPREFIFNGEQFRKHEADGTLVSWLSQLAFSRTGLTGPADMVLNSFTGLRYQRDLSNILDGAGLSSIFSDMQNMAGLFVNNTPNTNTSERAAAEGFYRLAIAPIASLALSALPLDNAIGSVPRYAAMSYLTSNAAAAAFADQLAGPPTTKEEHAALLKADKARKKAASGG